MRYITPRRRPTDTSGEPIFAIGPSAVALATGVTPRTVSGWALLALGSVASGVGAGMMDEPRAGNGPPWRAVVRRWVGKHWRPLVATATTAAVAVAGIILVPPMIARVWPEDCPQPTELRVLTSPDGLDPFRDVADVYERVTAERGCPTVNLHLYAPPARWALRMLETGWVDDRLADWPRPDVWLADSRYEVDKVVDGGGHPGPRLEMTDPRQFAFTPIVLGMRSSVGPQWWQQGLTWKEVFARSRGWGLVRSDPTASSSALYATAAIYDSHGGGGDQSRRIEVRIARSMAAGAYRVDDDAGEEALLRRYGALGESAPSTAAIVSEQALIRYNQQLGDDCGESSDELLIARYPADTLYLTRQFVRVGPVGSRQAEAASAFGEWLTSDDGRRALNGVGLRTSDGHSWRPFDGSCGVEPAPDLGDQRADPVDDDDVRAARAPGQLLLLLDTSGSMDQPVGDGRSRLDDARQGVLATLDLLTNRDEFGLWQFPGGDEDVKVLVPLAAAPEDPADDPGYVRRRQRAADNALAEVEAAGRTPLFDAILRGITEMESRSGDGVRAVVAVTDGEDTVSERTAEELRDAVVGRGVRVYVIAVGEARCSAPGVVAMTEGSGGDCRQATFHTLDDALAGLAGGIWGGNADAG